MILKFTFIASFFLFANIFYGQSCQHKHHHQKALKTSAVYNVRSDTMDVLNYNIYLDFMDYSNQNIAASCQVLFKSKMNGITTISLDLLQMNVDSIKQQSSIATFNYNDTLLIIDLVNTLNQNDTDSLTVYYHGSPQGDGSGFGGFYFQGNYAYNMGVGFWADPHNYGRVWHPCFDNFVERATYTTTIKTPINRTAYANGLIVSENNTGAFNERTWYLSQEIPTYLASVEVSDYTHVAQSYSSTLTGNTTPVYLIASPSDTTNFKASFTNLHATIGAFENSYGPYLWDKVGFNLVPFNSGAMEHATNIAYPIATANGTLNYETLMAHELSHHWWGDLVTCRTAEDMWINEGFASYSERLFMEAIYGYDAYIDDVKNNHKEVLHKAHINDGGYYAISGVPHDITYGDHSYNKGADVAHNLRTYMGDTFFFAGLQSFLDTYKFQDVSALDFRDHLNSLFAIVDVTDFFNDWVFNPGYPGFYIDSMVTTPLANGYEVEVFIHQKLKGTTQYFTNVPLEITFMDNNWTQQTEPIGGSGEYSSATFILPFHPDFSYLNGNDKISQAVTAENKTITTTGINNLTYPFMRYTTTNISDSAFVRVEHYWVAPDGFQEPTNEWMYEISQERFWKVDGIFPSDFVADARIYYNGKTVSSGNLDTELTSIPGFIEDSMVVLHRENAASLWHELADTEIHMQGPNTDGSGYFKIDKLIKGEYTFGWKKSTVGTIENANKEITLELFPNPTTDWIQLKTNLTFSKNTQVVIYNALGEMVYNAPFYAQQINVSAFAKGNYILQIKDVNNTYASEFIKQ